VRAGGRRETKVPDPSWSVLERGIHMYCLLRKPTEEEDFAWVNKGVEEGEEGEVVDLKRGVEGHEEVKVLNGDPK
jgi:hypothetical protein